MTQSDFWNLPAVRDAQDIQKRNPYGSDEHRAAFDRIKRLCAQYFGADFAQEYMGNYED